MQLNPRENFSLVRQIEDHTDSSTYFVQAVIRNAKTDALLATVNLTDQGNRRFSKVWQVPADVSGQGFWIAVLTSVYIDSGYTTKSANYGDKMETYLVQERPVFNPNYPIGAVGGGPDIDYKRIKKMIDDAVKSIEIPEAKVVEVTKEIVKEVKVPEVKIVETQKVQDLTPIIDEIKKVGKKVDDKEVTEIPEIPEVDFEPTMKCMNDLKKTILDGFEKTCKKVEGMKLKVEVGDFVKGKLESEEEEKEDPRITRLMKNR